MDPCLGVKQPSCERWKCAVVKSFDVAGRNLERRSLVAENGALGGSG